MKKTTMKQRLNIILGVPFVRVEPVELHAINGLIINSQLV